MPEKISAPRRSARARLANAKYKLSQAPDDAAAREAVEVAERDYWSLELRDHVVQVVDKAPPLTVAQRARLMVLLADPRDGS